MCFYVYTLSRDSIQSLTLNSRNGKNESSTPIINFDGNLCRQISPDYVLSYRGFFVSVPGEHEVHETSYGWKNDLAEGLQSFPFVIHGVVRQTVKEYYRNSNFTSLFYYYCPVIYPIIKLNCHKLLYLQFHQFPKVGIGTGQFQQNITDRSFIFYRTGRVTFIIS